MENSWTTGTITPKYFTMHNNHGELCIVFIKNPEVFRGTFVVVDSFAKRNPIMKNPRGPRIESNMIIFRCADCQRPEYKCCEYPKQGLPMYGIVFNGQPKQVCAECLEQYNRQGYYSIDHENKFFQLIYKEENATVRMVNPYCKNIGYAEVFIPAVMEFQYSNQRCLLH